MFHAITTRDMSGEAHTDGTLAWVGLAIEDPADFPLAFTDRTTDSLVV